MSNEKQVIGILGGGQLARMMVLEGAPLGAAFRIVDTAETPCAAQFAPTARADWRDLEALAPFAEAIDVATFDFENVPAETAQWLTEHVRVHPGPQALAVAQDRMAEKTLFREIGLDTARFAAIDTRADLDRALEEIGVPAILKTRRLGYDGKGQFRLRDVADADAAWDALGEQAAQHGLILESFVPFDYEVSVIAVRGRDGDFRTWPLTRNWHADGILSLSLAPAPGTEAIADTAFAHARTLAERLSYVGVFALELFVKDGRVLGNEMAPRVHNSGHWTYDGAVTSQFQNHVRAVLGLPLGDTAVRGCSVMFNWIGAMPDMATALAVDDVHWHDYGKSPRPGRKVGHATVCGPDFATVRARVQALAEALGRVEQAAPLLELPVS
ncbi:5-(carboxyamino)imidazole ribonucleotide synthase [Oleiagrimonas sp. MCCC 1A03011]|uniref:5-(carboxyamino)imidazole ribonucleotide synthase n=1 Tax=Oleiagrimonas sp. MCCC 1A03011 TaxID=1926883 RepID=UPI000DC4BB2E|nr:5-(carboxyamino)imidazole ribonucleotide synthase [Oleiagrimonas sp. MCCC 1A03011]RAP56275.1 5-(carboxyamino)imidazole ribonucleotide synthase [Oleiagrimonas sp. MCCC 1A03011]